MITKDETCIKYESVKKYSNCQVFAKTVKELGTMNALYYFIPYPLTPKHPLNYLGLTIDPNTDTPFINGLESECKVTKRWCIGKNIKEDIVWVEEKTELRRIRDNKVVYKTINKLWEYLPNEDKWGETYTEKLLNNGIIMVTNEKWKDTIQEKFRDFWAEKSDELKIIYHYGQKEKNDNLVTVIDRWEKKTEGTVDDFEYNEKFTIEFEGKSWGTKDGKKGSEHFHEKWNVDKEKFTEKWSEQRQLDGSLKKWGEKIKDLPDGTHEVEKWNEHTNHEGNYIELTINKQTDHSDGSKSGENFYKNSAKKMWQEKWEESAEGKRTIRNEDDGYGHKSGEVIGFTYGSVKCNYHDKYNEDVAANERYTEKTGHNETDGNKWICKIYDSNERNYVENIGENEKTTDKWIEKWFDDKRGTKWALKEGSNTGEGRAWKEQWNEKYGKSSIEKKCEKWGKGPEGEWLERWEEEYKDNRCLHKFCEKSFKNEEYSRKQRVDQYNKDDVKDGKELWWYKVEVWDNEIYNFKEFEQYE